jgi:hypothetical protein
MQEKRFLRGGIFHSLIDNDESEGFPIIGAFGGTLLSNNKYLIRCLSKFQNGKNDFQKKLVDARKIIFNKDELINWLYKIKEEAKAQTDLVFTRARVNYPQNDDRINFERIGYMAGLYKEADRFLSMMIAIEPIDKDKPHYSIIDRLVELDKSIIQKDIIPGYYRVQPDIRIKKHEFELRNLNAEWENYLSYKDNHDGVGEGFGDRAYFLENHHGEFTNHLTNIKPIGKIKEFLSYHYKGFCHGNKIDFLNHIQYRIIPRLDYWTGSDYPIYKQVIEEWLKKELFGLSRQDEVFLIQSLINTIESFLDDVLENRKRNDENKFNIVIKQAMNHRLSAKRWQIADQSLGGLTDSDSHKSRAGVAFRDLIVSNEEGRHIMALECFRLKFNPVPKNEKHEISLHVKKIFRNEPIGISPLGIIIYCETKKFGETWLNYLDYVENIDFQNYHLINLERDIKEFGDQANIKIAKALHNRELNTITVYHVMINMYP